MSTSTSLPSRDRARVCRLTYTRSRSERSDANLASMASSVATQSPCEKGKVKAKYVGSAVSILCRKVHLNWPWSVFQWVTDWLHRAYLAPDGC